MPVGFPRRRGVTLIEAVLFISIALGLIVGGIVFFQQAQTASRTSDTVRLFTALLSESRALLQNDPLAGNFRVDPVLVAADAVPGSAVLDPPVNGCRIVSPWGECITIQYSATRDTLVFHLHEMPREICSRLGVFDSEGNGPLGYAMSGLYIRDTNGWRTDLVTAVSNLVQHDISSGGISPSLAGQYCRNVDGLPFYRVEIEARWDR